MQYVVTVTVEQQKTAPAELQAAMTAFVETERGAGTFVLTGGLAPPEDSARVELSMAGVRRGVARLPIHGFAVVESSSLEGAMEAASRLLRVRQRYLPDWVGSCEVRPVVTSCLP